MTDYPPRWANAPLYEICAINPPVDKNSIDIESVVSFVPMSAVEAGTGKIDVSEARSFGAVRNGYTPFRKGDVLFAKITPCMENGKMAIVPDLVSEYGFGSTEFHVLRPADGIDPRFLYHAVSNRAFRFHAEHNMAGAVGQKRVPTTILEKHRIGLPPTKEQRRIADRIDTLFDEIDRGVESLRTAKTTINLYRQSLLRSAFEGRLTTQWRAENTDKLESPDALLTRIREEREKHHQAALDNWERSIARWRRDGGTGKKPTKPRPVPSVLPVVAEEVAVLPQLPRGWMYTKLANLGDLGRGKSRHRPRNDARLLGGSYPFIQTADVKAAGRTITTYRATYSELGLAQSKLWPEGTLCITIAANIAETAFLSFDACFPDSVVGFTAFEAVTLPEFVELFIKSARSSIESYAPATAQKNINLNTLETLLIPFCSPAEQAEIVRLLDDRLEATQMLEAEIDAAITRAEALRQSILKQAFSGQLVPQDPSDEPASALLARIRPERVMVSARGRKRRAATTAN